MRAMHICWPIACCINAAVCRGQMQCVLLHFTTSLLLQLSHCISACGHLKKQLVLQLHHAVIALQVCRAWLLHMLHHVLRGESLCRQLMLRRTLQLLSIYSTDAWALTPGTDHPWGKLCSSYTRCAGTLCTLLLGEVFFCWSHWYVQYAKKLRSNLEVHILSAQSCPSCPHVHALN